MLKPFAYVDGKLYIKVDEGLYAPVSVFIVWQEKRMGQNIRRLPLYNYTIDGEAVKLEPTIHYSLIEAAAKFGVDEETPETPRATASTPRKRRKATKSRKGRKPAAKKTPDETPVVDTPVTDSVVVPDETPVEVETPDETPVVAEPESEPAVEETVGEVA
jgi:hypothetical protein